MHATYLVPDVVPYMVSQAGDIGNIRPCHEFQRHLISRNFSKDVSLTYSMFGACCNKRAASATEPLYAVSFFNSIESVKHILYSLAFGWVFSFSTRVPTQVIVN